MSPSEILCELIAIPSVNPMGRELSGPIYFEQRLSDWLVSFFNSIGANCERIEVASGRANVIARYDSPRATRTLLFDAHQDTVPIDNMKIAPFAPQAGQGAPLTAERYTNAIVDYCEAMSTFPKRGTRRDDIRPGLRVTNYQGAAIIAFAVDDETKTVFIIGVFYGGQDFETLLQDDVGPS